MSENWIEACAVEEVPEGDVTAVEVAGREVALYEVDGEIFATANICTHGQARLCDGFLEDGAIECPLHQGRFDVRTGKALCAPLTEDLRTYPIKVEDGRVFVRLD
ncbi:MAG TPA: bifunctional 3-phenylpropionate/cinnamic acid dioxygenase ferredoxin subunit [Gammaproteobacteria bacterium]|jgi:naphthalene 1,2-dioxygenase system ferredoxin subunit|nr:bifunctional 3-phenylpropionate/cinnamic acid dioxygenase ferredoxin subunit [Gammaproteobacteria bacterium]